MSVNIDVKQKHEKTWKNMKRDKVSAYVRMTHDTPLPLYASVNILDDPPPFPQLRTYLMDSLFLNQKTNKNIRISYSLKYKHSKKNSLRKNK